MPRRPGLFVSGAICPSRWTGSPPTCRGAELTLLRAEFAALAIGRYQARTCDVADLLGEHPSSITRWLDRGLRLERDDPGFKRRVDTLNTLDEAASRRN